MNENDNIKNEQKDYILYKHFETQNLSYNSNKDQKNEKPESTIEKNLINILDKNI